MKLLVALCLTVGLASAMDTPRYKLMYKMKTWVRGATHCAEYATGEDGTLDEEKADECRRCMAGVGNWAVEENLKRGVECLNKYEPNFMEMCGEKLEAYGADPTHENELATDECWEECNLRRIADKCVQATGGEDMNIGLGCVMKHLTDNNKYARNRIYGDKHNPMLKPNKMEQEVEYLMEEGRCEHASEGNNDLKMQCNMCFNHVNRRAEKYQDEAGEFHTDTILPVVTMWIACADNYWSPHYSECFEGVDDLVGHIKEWNTEEYKAKQQEMQGCFALKQAQYWFQPCLEGAGEGVDGLVNYVHCARNTTLTWAADKRPEAAEYVRQFMNGGSLMPNMDE